MISTEAQITERLLRELCARPELNGKNLVLSPRSLHAAISLLYLGAEGPTRDELLALLGSGSESDLRARLSAQTEGAKRPESPLHGALGLFVSAGVALLPAFTSLARDTLSAQTEDLPFGEPAAAQRINEWVSEATAGRIADIVSSIDPAVRMLVVSALHFQADWATKFNASATFDRPFSRRSGEAVPRPAMHLTATFPLWRGEDWHLLEMPYERGDHSMVVALPADPRATHLDVGALGTGIAALEPALVQLQLPRFSVAADLSLSAALRGAGVRCAFDPARADFSRITSEQVFATDVLHKAVVAVTEEGTEAAAATLVPLAKAWSPRPKVPFVVDRPFWFVLRDRRDGGLLFVGRVEDPRG